LYSTYIGGTTFNSAANGIAVDSSGNVYVGGFTNASDFPITLGAFYSGGPGGGIIDGIFITKINSTGTGLLYSSVVVGPAMRGIAIDSAGNAYIAGHSGPGSYTSPGAFQPSIPCSGCVSPYTLKLNATGSAPVYATYLDGTLSTADDEALAVAADSTGNAYLTGRTSSPNFPTTPGAFQTQLAGTNCINLTCASDAFVTKFDSGGALVYSTYLGGAGGETGTGIAVDSAGNTYVTGGTESANFPTTVGVYQTMPGKAFVTRLNSTGSSLVYSTYLGGGATIQYTNLAIDSLGDAYIVGAAGPGMPIVNSIQQGFGGGSRDAFVNVLNSFGTTLTFGSYLGGTADDFGWGIVVDSSNNFYVAGSTNSVDFPISANALQNTYAGGVEDAFVAKFATGTPIVTLNTNSLKYGVQVIGTTSPSKRISVSNKGNVQLTFTSIAVTSNFILTQNFCVKGAKPGTHCDVYVAFTPIKAGSVAGTVTFTDNAPTSPQIVTLSGTGTVVRLAPTSLSFPGQTVGTKSAPKGVTLTNVGSTTLRVTGITITGANATDFSQTNACGTNVSAGASCTIKVIFAPKAKGARKATLNVNDNGGGSPQTVSLSGTGT